MTEKQRLTHLLHHVVACPDLHRRWLNTLSCMENCGARKIARCEHPIFVKREMLKHAAEEFRHALHLKQQIGKIGNMFEDYTPPNILGGYLAIRYLDKLDVAICRMLMKEYGLHSWQLKQVAYLLVTYAIEVRASRLYPCYQYILSANASPVSVRFIIAEEEHHLEEIEAQLVDVCDSETLKLMVCALEQGLFRAFLQALEQAVEL